MPVPTLDSVELLEYQPAGSWDTGWGSQGIAAALAGDSP